MKKLTLIMSALNEGQEPLRTVKSIRETSPENEIELILINDGTKANNFQDGWIEIPEERVIHHQSQMGRPYSMEEGVRKARSEYVGLLNAKMNFYPGWYEKVIKALEHSPKKNIIFQTTAVLLNAKREIVQKNAADNGKRYGAHIFFMRNRQILKPIFCKKPQEQKIYDIPGLLGANYFTSKTWFIKIKGWQGLYNYGGMDTFLALKSWTLGGRCQLIKDAEIGNVYRNWQYQNSKGQVLKPYSDNIVTFYYNKIFTAFVLLKNKDALFLLELLKVIAPQFYKPVRKMISENIDYIEKYRNFIQNNAVRDVYNFIHMKETTKHTK